ncbi:hypothetical protein B0A55_11118 [Friedmanniomyces simplex]|uniref:Uncharacterized protein n=1 Tax=Friedmanniomyces simplex TaxID=329884 RepID=A0A4U0WI38_9PEZI|nr:hypothetical protein B0A55_11118 [Friedmanniomyces simplex]
MTPSAQMASGATNNEDHLSAMLTQAIQTNMELEDRLDDMLYTVDTTRRAIERSSKQPTASKALDLLEARLVGTAYGSGEMTPPTPTKTLLGPLGGFDGPSKQGVPTGAKAVRFAEPESQCLCRYGKWVTVPPPPPLNPNVYGKPTQNMGPHLHANPRAPTFNVLPALEASMLAPTNGPSTGAAHQRNAESAPPEPGFMLIVTDPRSGGHFAQHLTSDFLKVACPTLYAAIPSACDFRDVDGSRVIAVTQLIDVFRDFMAFATHGVCDTPFAAHPLDHFRDVMTLASRWVNAALEEQAARDLTFAAAELPSEELYLLANMLVCVHQDRLNEITPKSVKDTIVEAAALRGVDLLKDIASIDVLKAGGAAPLGQFARDMAVLLANTNKVVDSCFLAELLQLDSDQISKPYCIVSALGVNSRTGYGAWKPRTAFNSSQGLYEIYKTAIKDDPTLPLNIEISKPIDAMQTCLGFVYSGICSGAPTKEPLEHYLQVMILASEWRMPVLEIQAASAFGRRADELRNDELIILAEMLVAAHLSYDHAAPPASVQAVINESAVRRGVDLLGYRDTAHLIREEEGGLVMYLFAKNLARALHQTRATLEAGMATEGFEVVGGIPPISSETPTTSNSAFSGASV